jgi:hypothetical protein
VSLNRSSLSIPLTLCSKGNESGAPTSYVPSETGHESALSSLKPKDLDVTGTGKDYGDGFVNFEQTFLQDELPRNTRPFEPWERQEMERLLGEVNGHLGGSDQ